MARTHILIATGFLGALAPAYGQSSDADGPIARCAEQSRTLTEERDCLRMVIRSLMSSGGVLIDSPQAANAASDVVEAANEPVTQPTPDIAQAMTASKEQKPAGMGAEQVMARQARAEEKNDVKSKEDKGEATVVVDFAYTPKGQLILVMKNGQVWRQRAGDRQSVRLNDGEQTPVIIRRGALSGYRIDFTEKHRTITVERLR